MSLAPTFFAHSFGQRYELPISLTLFLIGGASIVLLTFLIVLRRPVHPKSRPTAKDSAVVQPGPVWAAISFIAFGLLIAAGLAGTQEVSENILPTVFWLVVWIAVPISCGLIGDWTPRLNPYAAIGRLAANDKLRQVLLGRKQALAWPSRLGWWPATLLYFALACGELIYNRTATLPAVIAGGLLVYFVLSGFMGLLFGQGWLARGEVFSVLFSTWGRLGYFRFGAAGLKGFAGGLEAPFQTRFSRTAFVLLLLISVSFDGLISTTYWNNLRQHMPGQADIGSAAYTLSATLIFLLMGLAIWALFSTFALLVSRAGRLKTSPAGTLSALLSSLLPISFGYLLAHNIQYLLVNGQLLLPLVGNPTGRESWPIHLPYPFNDSYTPNINILPNGVYWYFALLVIVAVHIVAVIVAHRHLGRLAQSPEHARRAEYPWIIIMVAYTVFSLWLLSQPIVKEKSHEESKTSGAYLGIARPANPQYVTMEA